MNSEEFPEDSQCKSCTKPIDSGSVISFGDGVWHLNCFRCSKCKSLIDHEANLLLVADGYPICEKCSYLCAVCKKPILDEAILTGDVSYHETCFKCCTCGKSLDDLVYTKTDRGISCVKCASTSSRGSKQTSAYDMSSSSSTPTSPITEQAPTSPTAEPSSFAPTTNTIKRRVSISRSGRVISAQSSTLTEKTAPIAENPVEDLRLAKLRIKELEVTLDKMKSVSKTAIEEFQSMKVDMNREKTVRQKAERAVSLLKQELDRYIELEKTFMTEKETWEAQQNARSPGKSNEQVLKLEEALSRLKFENTALTTRTTELAAKNNELGVTIKELASSNVKEATEHESLMRLAKSLEGEVSTLKQQKSSIEEQLDHLKRERSRMEDEVKELRPTRELLVSSIDKLKKDKMMLQAEIRLLEAQKLDEASAQPLEHSNSRNNSTLGSHSTLSMGPESRARKLLSNFGSSMTLNSNVQVAQRKSILSGPSKTADSPTDSMEHGIHEEGKSVPKLMKWMTKKKKKDSEDVEEVGEHTFHQQAFLVPVKCSVCNEKIWGMKAKELQCKECGTIAHIKCLPLVKPECKIEPRQPGKIFGTDLVAQCQLEKSAIPLIVEKCALAIEERGLDYEGIYRKSGLQSQIRALIESFDQSRTFGADINLLDTDKFPDVNVISGVMKQYFRSLPVPLTTFELYAVLIAGAMEVDERERLGSVITAISSLPVENYETLKYLVKHLSVVCAQAHKNLMGARNIAVVFGPNLIKSQTAALSAEAGEVNPDLELGDMGQRNNVIEFIVTNQVAIFDECDAIRVNRLKSASRQGSVLKMNAIGESDAATKFIETNKRISSNPGLNKGHSNSYLVVSDDNLNVDPLSQSSKQFNNKTSIKEAPPQEMEEEPSFVEKFKADKLRQSVQSMDSIGPKKEIQNHKE